MISDGTLKLSLVDLSVITRVERIGRLDNMNLTSSNTGCVKPIDAGRFLVMRLALLG